MEVKKVKFQDIPEIGRAIYKDKILPTLGPEDDGKLVVIDVTTGNYEIDGRDIDLCDKLLERNHESSYLGGTRRSPRGGFHGWRFRAIA